MRYRYSSLLLLAAAISACSDEPGTTAPPSSPPPPPPPRTVLLKDIVIPNLPSPYYHFEYDTLGRIKAVSFASGLRMYDVIYGDDGRIMEMRNNVIVNHDRLVYAYDESPRVGAIRFVESTGRIVGALIFSYDGEKLTGIERVRLFGSGFITDKTMSLSYYPDGNLLELTEHHPSIDGQQTETTTVDRFEQYDDKINVDGFGLIHTEFFEHLVLLPGVQLQRSNPGRQIRTGDGLNFRVDYRYTYDDTDRPLTKTGEATLLNGPDAGRRFEIGSVFSYY